MTGIADLHPDNLSGDELDGTCRRLQTSTLIDDCLNPERVRAALQNGNRAERVEALWKLKGVARARRHEEAVQVRVGATSPLRGSKPTNRDGAWKERKLKMSRRGPAKGNNPAVQQHGRRQKSKAGR